jgi:putative transposase
MASVLDMASRRVLGFTQGERHGAALAYGALAMAIMVRGGQVPGVVFHTDQGTTGRPLWVTGCSVARPRASRNGPERSAHVRGKG